MMATRAHPYPQVELGAAGLVEREIVTVPRPLSIADALSTARRRDVRALCAGDAVILRGDLARAADARRRRGARGDARAACSRSSTPRERGRRASASRGRRAARRRARRPAR